LQGDHAGLLMPIAWDWMASGQLGQQENIAAIMSFLQA
jgi:hypothetical protein